MQTPVVIAGIVTVAGFLIMGLGGIMFRVRAVLNKPAWNGGTLPLIFIGLVVALIGGVLLWVTYPR